MKRSLRERLRMRKRAYVPNVILKGFATAIPDKSTLQNIFYFTPNNLPRIVRGFKIIGDDVYFQTINTFGKAQDGYYFNGNNDIKEFIDLDSFFMSIPNHSFFANTPNFTKFIANGMINMAHSVFLNSAVKHVEINSLTTINQHTFRDAIDLSFFKADSLITLGHRALEGCGLSTVNLPNLENIIGYNIGETSRSFANMPNVTEINIRKCKNIGGTPSIYVEAFSGIKLGCVININDFMKTVNDGEIHPDLLYAYTSRNATINFYDDNGDFVETYNPQPDLYTQNDACSIGANETESIGAGWSVSDDNEIGLSIASGNNSSWSLKATKIGTDQDDFGGYVILSISGFEPNETYRFSADSRATNATEDGAGQGWIETWSGSIHWQSHKYFNVDTFEWTNKSFECTPLSETASFRLYPSLTTEGTMQNWSCFLDNIVIEKISNPDPEPEVLAFPGAVGFGKNATGGRGGAVIKVTNLNDSGSGSLRQALQHTSGPRTIVFEVGGVINLTSSLDINNGDVTIAGQTATGDGIVITGACLSISASNIIMRYLRSRPTENAPHNMGDGIRLVTWNGIDIEDVIIDHCSMSWASGPESKNLNVRTLGPVEGGGGTTPGSIRRFTLQNSIVSESLYGYLGFGNTFDKTVYKNLFAFNSQRNIRTNYPTDGTFDFEMINNLVYGCWAGLGVSYGSKFSAISNHFKASSEQGMYEHIIDITPAGQGKPVETHAYISGNVVPNGHDEFNYNLLNTYIQTEPYKSSGIVPIPAIDVEEDIKSHVGASLPKRDNIDEGIITKLNNNVGEVTLTGTIPPMSGGTPPTDSNNDGIPDDWTSNNMPTGATYNDIAPSGYTWIEEYLNQIDQ